MKMSLEELEKELNRATNEYEESKRKEWESKTPLEKIDSYRKQIEYREYCDMTIEELEKEMKFNKEKADSLRYSMFHDPYYSAYGCDENVRRINTILKLKKEGK